MFVAKLHSLFVAKVACYSLQKLLAAKKSHSLLVAKVQFFQYNLFHKGKKFKAVSSQHITLKHVASKTLFNTLMYK